MNTRLMKIIKDEDERNKHEWKAYTLKEGKQLLTDAIVYQKYYNEEVDDDSWEAKTNKERTQFSVFVGLYTHTTMNVSLTQARKLAEEMWKSAEGQLAMGHLIGGHVYLEVDVGKYHNKFHVKTDGEVHINQHIFDKCNEYKDELFRQQEEEE